MRYAWDLTFDYLNHSSMGKGIAGGFYPNTCYIDCGNGMLSQLIESIILLPTRTIQLKEFGVAIAVKLKLFYPPVNLDRFSFQAEKEDFYVTVCRLVSYKKVALIVEAFNRLPKNH